MNPSPHLFGVGGTGRGHGVLLLDTSLANRSLAHSIRAAPAAGRALDADSGVQQRKAQHHAAKVTGQLRYQATRRRQAKSRPPLPGYYFDSSLPLIAQSMSHAACVLRAACLFPGSRQLVLSLFRM